VDTGAPKCAVGSNYYCVECGLGYTLSTFGIQSLDQLQMQNFITKTVQYYDTATTCKPIIPNCATYDFSASLTAPAKCLVCDTGYVLLTDGTCLQATALTDCAVYTSATACAECVDTKILIGGKCVASVSFDVDHCVAYSSQTTCAQCAPSYYLDAATNTCLPVATTLTNCYLATDSTTCTQCVTGYFLVGGACVLITDYTANCYKLSDKKCLICQPNFIVAAGKCVAISSTTTPAAIANCALYNEDGSCLSCNTKYYKSGSTCVSPGDPYCLI